MSTEDATECCLPFHPELWEEKEQIWENRLFVKDRVISFLHIPLNFGKVMTRNAGPIQAANATAESQLVLTDENSLWGADIYIEVTKDIPDAKMTTISGTFHSKVFEGPYSNIRKWINEMKTFMRNKEKQIKKLYFFYTTCPKCAKKYGKNYVVLIAQE